MFPLQVACARRELSSGKQTCTTLHEQYRYVHPGYLSTDKALGSTIRLVATFLSSSRQYAQNWYWEHPATPLAVPTHHTRSEDLDSSSSKDFNCYFDTCKSAVVLFAKLYSLLGSCCRLQLVRMEPSHDFQVCATETLTIFIP